MDRRNFLAIILSMLLLITCSSKQAEPQNVDTNGWILIGKEGYCYLYMRCVPHPKFPMAECNMIYWSVCASSSYQSSVTTH